MEQRSAQRRRLPLIAREPFAHFLDRSCLFPNEELQLTGLGDEC